MVFVRMNEGEYPGISQPSYLNLAEQFRFFGGELALG